MAQATFFDYETGEITGTITCSESAFWLNVEGQDWIAGAFSAAEYYVDAKEYRPVLRPSMEYINVKDNTISGLPIPCTVDCNGGAYEVSDGVFEYDTPLAGTYHFRVMAFPFRDFEGDLTVSLPETKDVTTETTVQITETTGPITKTTGPITETTGPITQTPETETEPTEEVFQDEDTTSAE